MDGLTLISLISSFVILILATAYWRLKKTYGFFAKREIPGPYPTFPLGTWKSKARNFIGGDDIENVEKYGSLVGSFDGLTPNLLVTDLNLVEKFFYGLPSRRVQRAKSQSLKEVLRILDEDLPKEVAELLPLARWTDKLVPQIESSTTNLINSLLDEEEEKILINDKIADFVETVCASAVLGLDLNEDAVFRQRFVQQSRRILAGSLSASTLNAITYLYGGSDNSTFSRTALEYFKEIISSRLRDQENIGKQESIVRALVASALVEKALTLKEKAQENSEESKEETFLLDEDLLTHLTLATVISLLHYAKNKIVFSLYALARNEEVQKKLREEIDESSAGTDKEITTGKVQKLRYLQAFLTEVDRKYPAEFRLEKITSEETTLPDGIQLPKNTTITIPVFALHNSKSVPHPEQFSPDRFLSEKYTEAHPVIRVPIGSNLPARLSDFVVSIAIVKVLSRVKLETDECEVVRRGLTGFVLPVEVKLGVKARD